MKRVAVLFSLLFALLVPASAQMTLTGVGGGFGAAAGGGINYTTFTPPAILASPNPNTFTGANIGTAAADRLVIVCVGVSGNGPVTAVTVGATSLTLAAQSSAGAKGVSLWAGIVATGATANITAATTTTFPPSIGIAVATINTATPTPGTSQVLTYGFGNDPQTTASVTVPGSGVAVLCGASETPASPTFNNWTSDQQVSAAGWQINLGHISTTGAPSISGFAFAGYGIAATPWGP
jgi:hypothetical protein